MGKLFEKKIAVRGLISAPQESRHWSVASSSHSIHSHVLSFWHNNCKKWKTHCKYEVPLLPALLGPGTATRIWHDLCCHKRAGMIVQHCTPHCQGRQILAGGPLAQRGQGLRGGQPGLSGGRSEVTSEEWMQHCLGALMLPGSSPGLHQLPALSGRKQPHASGLCLAAGSISYHTKQ